MTPAQSLREEAQRTLLNAGSECGLSEVMALSAAELNSLPTRHGLPIEAAKGSFEINGQVAHLVIAAKPGWPNSLPLVFLEPWNAFGQIPHVEADGFVCFAHEANLIIDSTRPKDVAIEAGNRALEQIARGAQGMNRSDFASEFDAYWARQKGTRTILSFVEPSNGPKAIQIVRGKDRYVWVCDRQADAARFFGTGSPKQLTQRNGLFVPLRVGATVIPPHPDQPWEAEQAVDRVMESIDESTRRGITSICSKLKKEREFVVVYLPKPDGDGGTMFGLEFCGEKGYHPFSRRKESKTVIPYVLTRMDRTMIQPRGGANKDLHDKRVGVIGCGSVGGFLAFELARAGVGDLTLIDPETLAEENIFRHVLGKKYIGKQKTLALQADLIDRIPFLNVTTHEAKLERSLHENGVDLTDLDAVVCTVGSTSTERYLNRLVHEAPHRMPPALYTWVEAYGIGGHMLVTNNNGGGSPAGLGCLECLYTPVPDEPDGMHCRASFAKPGQEFGRNISGCSGLFIPYGSTTAVKAAAQACEATVDVLLGNETGNPLLSFKGSTREFIENGFYLSDRFTSFSTDELFEMRYRYVNRRCPVCGDES
jgi:hypothetical protein